MTTARDSIEVTIKTLVESLNAGDAAGVAALYTDDAALLPPDAARIDGRAGIQGVWQGLIDAEYRDVAMTTQEVDVFGDVANEVGTISATAPGERRQPRAVGRQVCGGVEARGRRHLAAAPGYLELRCVAERSRNHAERLLQVVSSFRRVFGCDDGKQLLGFGNSPQDIPAYGDNSLAFAHSRPGHG